jgi:hypothetical protein
MEELRRLVFKYAQVIKRYVYNLLKRSSVHRYYVQYIHGYDAIVVSELTQQLGNVSDDDSIILSSFCRTLAELSADGMAVVISQPHTTAQIRPHTTLPVPVSTGAVCRRT